MTEEIGRVLTLLRLRSGHLARPDVPGTNRAQDDEAGREMLRAHDGPRWKEDRRDPRASVGRVPARIAAINKIVAIGIPAVG